jgi:hypothetical protein
MPHHSHLFKGHPDPERRKAIDDILSEFDAELVLIHHPGERPRGWINSPNLGHPQDSNREGEITDALQQANLWPIVLTEEERQRQYEQARGDSLSAFSRDDWPAFREAEERVAALEVGPAPKMDEAVLEDTVQRAFATGIDPHGAAFLVTEVCHLNGVAPMPDDMGEGKANATELVRRALMMAYNLGRRSR